ncbi:MAG: regulatory protein RecX, partial [Giesbergeria sp.]|nr:regulatory protein RecX [Giesbergeria sp.]
LERVLDDLQAKGFISQERVVASVLNRRAAHLGAARVRQELQSKGIDAALVKDAVAGLQDSELERARAVWLRRFGDSPPQDARQWARQMRFLMARGFSGDVVRRVVPDAPR